MNIMLQLFCLDLDILLLFKYIIILTKEVENPVCLVTENTSAIRMCHNCLQSRHLPILVEYIRTTHKQYWENIIIICI